MKGVICSSCGNRISVSCECGMTVEVHIARAITLSIVTFLFCSLAGCWVQNYYATEAIKAIGNRPDMMIEKSVAPIGPEYFVAPKPEKK